MSSVDSLVQEIWDYMLVGQEMRAADCIFVLGSHDLRVADYAVKLYQQAYAPYLLFSGGVVQRDPALGVFWDTTEAEYFARRAAAMGVPDEAILIENRSQNTGENIRFTRKLVESRGLGFQSYIMVQKPYMERRVLATALKQWPGIDVVVTSPAIACAEYLNGDLPRDAVVQHIVGDLQRIKVYGENGFQTPQEIPTRVWDAFEQLVALGYDKRLLDR